MVGLNNYWSVERVALNNLHPTADTEAEVVKTDDGGLIDPLKGLENVFLLHASTPSLIVHMKQYSKNI
jgi:hypothetical protein